MSYNLYENMMFQAGEEGEVYGEALISVEIAERTCKGNNGVFLRVAFDNDDQVYEIGFNNKEQLRQVADALNRYLNPDSPD